MNYKILNDVYLLPNGVIFDNDMKLLKMNRNHDIVYTEKDFEYTTIIELEDDDYIDLTHYYSHWPFAHRYDCLSRIRQVENFITDNTKFLLGIDATANKFSVGRFAEETRLFGVEKIIYHKPGTLFKIKKLIYPLWVFGDAPCAFSEESYDYCKNKYRAYYVDKDKVNLFLTRSNNLSRCILNSEYVNSFFKNNGFIIMDGSENLKTTIELFYNANIIVGVHGGLFSNILFCNKVQKIVEILSSSWENYCFASWNQHIKTNYENIKVISDMNGNINFDQNLLNDIKQKIRIINNV